MGWRAVIVLLSTTIGFDRSGLPSALIPIATASLTAVGYDDLINIWFFCCTITPGFISLAVMLRTQIPAPDRILLLPVRSAGRWYLREPTIYGICQRWSAPYYAY